jgi:uncharacterized protein with HEPN domain
LGYAAGRTRADLDTNPMLVRALTRCVEVVGEAASRVTAETRTELSGIPWFDIVAMRNRLIHTYFDIDLDVVWATVEVDLPSPHPLAGTVAPGTGECDPPRKT